MLLLLSLVVGRWLSVVGRWSLVVGRWDVNCGRDVSRPYGILVANDS